MRLSIAVLVLALSACTAVEPDADPDTTDDAGVCGESPGTCDFFVPCPDVADVCDGLCSGAAECCSCDPDTREWQLEFYDCACSPDGGQ